MSQEFFQTKTRKVLGKFTIQALDYPRYREFCRDLVFNALIEAPFEITRENVNQLKDVILFELLGEVVRLTAQNMGTLGKIDWIKKHGNKLIV